MSASTRYLRFLTIASDLSEEALTYLTDVDQKNHIALVATMTSPDLKVERGVGVARAIRLADDPDVAEAAITVVDDMQKRGIGSVLALELERAARAAGIRTIRAEVLEDNALMRAILENAGATRVEAGSGPGTLCYDIALEPAHASSWIADILRAAARTVLLDSTAPCRQGPAPAMLDDDYDVAGAGPLAA